MKKAQQLTTAQRKRFRADRVRAMYQFFKKLDQSPEGQRSRVYLDRYFLNAFDYTRGRPKTAREARQPACNTGGCFAGWGVILFSRPNMELPLDFTITKAAQLLGIPVHVALELKTFSARQGRGSSEPKEAASRALALLHYYGESVEGPVAPIREWGIGPAKTGKK